NRRLRALSRRSTGSSRGNPVVTRTSADAQASSPRSGGRSSRMTGSKAPGAFRTTTSRRSGSIGTANRTRAIGHPRAPRDLSLSTSGGSALRVPAGVALHAALFEDEGLAALRAFGIQAFLQELRGVARLLLQLDVRFDSPTEFVERLDWRLHARLLHPDVPLDRLRDRVGDRVHALGVVDRDPRTANSFELVDDLVEREARAQAEGDEPCDAFREGGRVTASAADLREDLEQAVLVLVDGHV